MRRTPGLLHGAVSDPVGLLERADRGQRTVRRVGAILDAASEQVREPVAPDEQLASELADVLEVLRALATAHGMTWEDIASHQARRKRAERGGFDRRIFLEHVDQVLRPMPG